MDGWLKTIVRKRTIDPMYLFKSVLLLGGTKSDLLGSPPIPDEGRAQPQHWVHVGDSRLQRRRLPQGHEGQHQGRAITFPGTGTLLTVAQKGHPAFFCFLDFHVRFPPQWKRFYRGENVFTAVETWHENLGNRKKAACPFWWSYTHGLGSFLIQHKYMILKGNTEFTLWPRS